MRCCVLFIVEAVMRLHLGDVLCPFRALTRAPCRRRVWALAGRAAIVMLQYHFSISIRYDTIFTQYRDIDIDIDIKYVSKMHTSCRLKF